MLTETVSNPSLSFNRSSNDPAAAASPAGRLAGPGGRTRDSTPKAIADVACASILIVLAAPIILVVMLLVRLTSRGPALYTQTRLGLGGRSFTIYKVRTMRHDCERLSGPRWATEGDPRVTFLGRFLRRAHLDELPQLWNVLRGEMSLVGPRPERPELVRQLERAVPRYRERLRVRPGITGLAQVQLPPDSNLAGVRRKIACDLLYLERMGPALDLKILLATAAKLAGIPAAITVRWLRLPVAPLEELEHTDGVDSQGIIATRPAG